MTSTLTRRAALAALLATTLAGCASLGSYTPATLEGSIVAPQTTLARDKTQVSVRLLDVGREGAPPAVLAEQLLDKPRNFPLNYSLCYDKRAVNAGGSYRVEARVFVDGELRLSGSVAASALGGDKPMAPRLELQPIAR